MTEKNNSDLARDPRSLITARVFAAPRALVWAAWTAPEHLARWWGPIGFSTTTHAFDFRPGGVWRFVMHGPDGRDYQNRIAFEEIVNPNASATDTATTWTPCDFAPPSRSRILEARTRASPCTPYFRPPPIATGWCEITGPTRVQRRRWDDWPPTSLS